MVETWSEAHAKGVEYLIDAAVATVRFHNAVSVENGSEIPLPEIIGFVASDIANDVFPLSTELEESDALYARMLRNLYERFGIASQIYHELAMLFDLEQFSDYVVARVETMMKTTGAPLRAAVAAAVGAVFADLDDHPTALAKVLQEAEETYKPPIENRAALEAQMIDQIVKSMRQ